VKSAISLSVQLDQITELTYLIQYRQTKRAGDFLQSGGLAASLLHINPRSDIRASASYTYINITPPLSTPTSNTMNHNSSYGSGDQSPTGGGEPRRSYPSRTPSRSPFRSRGLSQESMLDYIRHSPSPLPGYRGTTNVDRNYSTADFEDVVTTYGHYSTLELIQGSLFYTQTEIPTTVEARNLVPEHTNTLTRAVSATHPIPHRLLREFDRESLQDLGDDSEEELWEVARSE
jgi:hypothetical protein